MAIYVANNGQLQTVKGIYYGMTEDYINATLFHNLVPKTATEIRFLYASDNPDLTDYQKLGYCDNNNFIEVWNNGTKYIIINPKKNYIYAPVICSQFLYNYTALVICNIENFNTQNVTNMQYMFGYCRNITSLDLSNFDTQNVTNMSYIFSDCINLRTIDISSFNTEKVTQIIQMFYKCSNLTSLYITNFNTSNMLNMQGAFSDCVNLRTIDISNFNTEKVTRMSYMFSGCNRLKTIFANTFNTASVTNSSYMFLNCTSLVGGSSTPYSSSHTNAEYARVDGENGLPGYFTAPN